MSSLDLTLMRAVAREQFRGATLTLNPAVTQSPPALAAASMVR